MAGWDEEASAEDELFSAALDAFEAARDVGAAPPLQAFNGQRAAPLGCPAANPPPPQHAAAAQHAAATHQHQSHGWRPSHNTGLSNLFATAQQLARPAPLHQCVQGPPGMVQFATAASSLCTAPHPQQQEGQVPLLVVQRPEQQAWQEHPKPMAHLQDQQPPAHAASTANAAPNAGAPGQPPQQQVQDAAPHAAEPPTAPRENQALVPDAAAAPTAAAGAAAAAADAAAGAAGDALPRRRTRLRQLFDFLLVMDLEATCDRDKATQPVPQEVIELSCVVVDTARCALLPATFQRYVRPDQHPRLTEFCTELTGISQDLVDGGVPLKAALADLEAWLREQGLVGQGKQFVPVTWRDWDLKIQLRAECKWRGIAQPRWQQRWVDLSVAHNKHSKARGNLRACCEAAGLGWDGRAHSALDDARNTARLAVKLMQSGVILGITGSFTGVDASGRFKQATLFAPKGGAGGSGKGGGGGGAGGGFASGGSGGPPRKKVKVFGADGAWTGECFCGARATKRQVKKPGPNLGRWFWSCGRYNHTGGGAECDFWKLEDAVGPQPATAKGSGKARRWGRG